MKKPRRPAEQQRVKLPSSAVMLWERKLVIANRVEEPIRRSHVALAPAAGDPASGRRVDTAILSLADASASLAAHALDARARATEAASARERVTAAMAAYRLEASFDQVLTGTYRQVTALMQERGLA
jgi:hypothetical protein